MVLSTLALVLAGCSTSMLRDRTYPSPMPLDSLAEADIAAIIDQPLSLREPLTAGLIHLDVTEPGGGENGGEESVDDLARSLAGSPFADVTILSPLLTRSAGVSGDLAAYRTEAARFQKDVLILLVTARREYTDCNFLAPTYAALVPAFFIPALDLSVLTTAEACAMDVRTGIFLACARGRAESQDRFVVATRAGKAGRELEQRALAAALGTLAADLRQAVERRLTTARYRSDVASPLRKRPVGIPYATVSGQP